MTWLLGALLFWQAATDPLAEGNKALEAQQFQTAVAAYKKVLAGDPGDVQAHFNLALAYSALKDSEAAKNEYREVLRLSPKLYQAEINMGLVLLQEGDAEEALPFLSAAVQHKPDSSSARRAYGDALLQLKKYPDAEVQYRAANQDSADVEIGLARALAGQDKLAEAAPHYQRAATLNPYFRTAPLELAQQYEAKGAREEAAAVYRQFRGERVADERLAALQLQQGEFTEVIPRLEEAVRQQPSTASRLALATAYLRTKQADKAAPLLEQAIKDNPNDLEVRLTYGRILRDQRKYAPAAQEFYRVAQAKPDNRDAWGELAAMLILLEQYPQGLSALDRVKALGGENAGYYYLRAIVLDKLKQFKPALESYQQFLALSNGKSPDEEFKARQRARILQREIQKH